MSDAADTSKVSAGEGTYAEKIAACGCRGVPEGQHIVGCPQAMVEEATRCSACGFRTSTERDHCGLCGTPKTEQRRPE